MGARACVCVTESDTNEGYYEGSRPESTSLEIHAYLRDTHT